MNLEVQSRLTSADECLTSGRRMLECGRYEDAIPFINRALELSPDSVDAHLMLAFIHETHSRMDDAVLHCRAVIEIRPDWAEAHHNLGRVLIQAGRFADAISSFRAAIRLKPDLGTAHFHLGVALLAQGNPAGAVAEFERSIAHHHEPATVYFHLGLALLSLGKKDEAIHFLREGISRDKTNAEFHLHLGLALEAKGDIAGAAESYKAAIESKPSPELICRLALTQQALGRLPQAEEAFRRALEMDANCTEAHYGLGYVLKLQGRLPEALRAGQSAIMHNPGWHKRHILLKALLEDERQVVDLLVKNVSDPDLRRMISDLQRAPEIYHPSKFWLFHLLLNSGQLEESGIENFKRTVNANYFNWILDGIEGQFETLGRKFAEKGISQESLRAGFDDSVAVFPEQWTPAQSERYREFLVRLWTFARSCDKRGLLSHISEPPLGNPIAIRRGPLLVSQDLCNSVLEANAILDYLPTKGNGIVRVAELGAGYGRLPYVLLQAIPNLRITIIDIPPALYVAQWYYSSLLPESRVFKYREFSSYEQIRSEFENASVAFLLAHQVELLPPDSFDLFINIASLQEMRQSQIDIWLGQIDRLCSGFFYSKQYFESINDLDEVCIAEKDYPIRPHWVELFRQPCAVQEKFFESLYRLRPAPENGAGQD